MPSLSTPASVSKRKQACRSCRQRKKRCNGGRPTCALCEKWGLRCEYSVPAASASEVGRHHTQFMGTLFGKQPFFPLDLASYGRLDPVHVIEPGLEIPTADNVSNNAPLENTILSNPTSIGDTVNGLDILAETALPPQDILLAIVDLFFANYHCIIPCFHKATFYSQLHSGQLQSESSLLLYSICATAAHLHPDPLIKAQQDTWYNHAKFLYELTPKDPYPALHTLRAVLCLFLHGSIRADYSSCWLFLGKAWRQAACLGMNKQDSKLAMDGLMGRSERLDDKQNYPWARWDGKTALEREECRRTLWLLYIMDSNMTWPIGWPSAIDERQFKLDIPIPEAAFQSLTEDAELSSSENTPFVRNLNTMIASTSIARSPLNSFHYFIVAHVVARRIAEHVHSLHDSPDTPEYAQQCESLDASVMKLRLSLPRTMLSVLEATNDDRPYAICLNIMLNSMVILLHYREAYCSSPEERHNLFIRAVVAAKNTALVAKDTARISKSLLYQLHLLSSLYLSGCILVMHWRLEHDESCKDDIEILKLILDNAADETRLLGRKYRDALKRDMERSDSELLKLREAGYRGLLAECSKWKYPGGDTMEDFPM